MEVFVSYIISSQMYRKLIIQLFGRKYMSEPSAASLWNALIVPPSLASK
jgi:hypothetical protein